MCTVLYCCHRVSTQLQSTNMSISTYDAAWALSKWSPANFLGMSTTTLSCRYETIISGFLPEGVFSISADLTEDVFSTSSVLTEGVFSTSALLTEGVFSTSAVLTEGVFSTSALFTEGVFSTSAVLTEGVFRTSDVLTEGVFSTSAVLTHILNSFPSVALSNYQNGPWINWRLIPSKSFPVHHSQSSYLVMPSSSSDLHRYTKQNIGTFRTSFLFLLVFSSSSLLLFFRPQHWMLQAIYKYIYNIYII